MKTNETAANEALMAELQSAERRAEDARDELVSRLEWMQREAARVLDDVRAGRVFAQYNLGPTVERLSALAQERAATVKMLRFVVEKSK